MMKRVRKTISILLSVVLLCTMMCTVHAAGSYFLKDGFYFGVKEEEAYIHGTDGSGWDIVIPETFLDYYVTEIEEFAFYENSTIELLSFYEASQLMRLGDGAFSSCPKLKKVHITESIQEMGVGVFEGCTALSSVRFRDGALTDIPAQCFYGCATLSNVIFDNEITSIGNLAFAGCSALTKLEIPDSVADIANNAFEGCDSLVIYCAKDSYALQYAMEHNIDYVITNPDPVTYMIGDADGDEIITVCDATVIQRVLASMDVFHFVEVAADIDKNGLDITDATKIQRFLADYNDLYRIGEVDSYIENTV